jgi:hypothetical protein
MESFLFILTFALGYIAGSLDTFKRSFSRNDSPVLGGTTSFVSSVAREQKQNNPVKSKISIDDSKYVTDISTDGMESKGKQLGVVSTTSDNISSAASKLAQLKKMKDS